MIKTFNQSKTSFLVRTRGCETKKEKTMKNKILFIIMFGMLLNIVSAFLISDQGGNVKEITTGNLTALSNLTIGIYDNLTGGNLIFEQNFSGGIVNGSWNVMINPTLEYGKSYWKDYKINGEDLDFEGNETLEFQSSLGKIHNISFINFSLINSCSAGNSIRLIYENGSVECETDDSTSVNLTSYALKNQSETFEGNITTNHTGFFGWLGSLTSRITNLFVQDINFNGTINGSGSINITGNISASYFMGDGSLLINLPSSVNHTNITWFLYNSTWDESNLIDLLNSSVTNRFTVYNNSARDFTLYVNTTIAGYVDANSGLNHTNITWFLYNSTWDESNLIDLLNSSVTNRFTVYNNSARDFTLYVNTTAGTYAIYVNSTAGTYANFINTSAIGWANYLNTTAGTYTLLVNSTSASYARYVNTTMASYAVSKAGDTMTGNLNMTVKNLTSVDCVWFNSGGRICSA